MSEPGGRLRHLCEGDEVHVLYHHKGRCVERFGSASSFCVVRGRGGLIVGGGEDRDSEGAYSLQVRNPRGESAGGG